MSLSADSAPQACELPIKTYVNLTKVMASHDLPRSTLTNQITFGQRFWCLAPQFERALGGRHEVLVSRLQT